MELELLIPLLAIAGGIPLAGFTVWLNFKTEQRKLGASTDELEEETRALREALDASEAERKRLTERVENIETIVTSEAWDTLASGKAASLPGGEREEASRAEKTARLARRVQE